MADPAAARANRNSRKKSHTAGGANSAKRREAEKEAERQAADDLRRDLTACFQTAGAAVTSEEKQPNIAVARNVLSTLQRCHHLWSNCSKESVPESEAMAMGWRSFLDLSSACGWCTGGSSSGGGGGADSETGKNAKGLQALGGPAIGSGSHNNVASGTRMMRHVLPRSDLEKLFLQMTEQGVREHGAAASTSSAAALSFEACRGALLQRPVDERR